MMPVGPLMIEHRLIERMIALLEKHVNSVAAPNIDLSLIERGVDFLRSYADRCHHGKEEDILFKALVRKQLTDDEKRTFEELVAEHGVARATVKNLSAARERALAGSPDAFGEIAELVGSIGRLYPAHIAKEDKHFFIPVMAYFTEEEQGKMLAEFNDFDRRLIHEKYRNIVTQLESSAAAG